MPWCRSGPRRCGRQLAAELTELRQMGDQRMERYIARFQQLEERLRELDSAWPRSPRISRRLRRRDEEIEVWLDVLEERHLRKELEGIEAQIEDMRLRRTKHKRRRPRRPRWCAMCATPARTAATPEDSRRGVP